MTIKIFTFILSIFVTVPSFSYAIEYKLNYNPQSVAKIRLHYALSKCGMQNDPKNFVNMVRESKKCPPSKTNFPGPYPVTGYFKPARDNIISTITVTGADGKSTPPKNQADLCSKTTEKPLHVGRGKGS